MQDAQFILSWLQEPFQAPLLSSFLSLLWASSNWEKKGTPLLWLSLLRAFFFPDPSPVSPVSWERMPGPWMRSWPRLFKNSSTPSRLKLVSSSFFSWTIRLPKRRERRYPAALGIKITPGTPKILQCIKDKSIALELSIRFLAFQVRRKILVERITLSLKTLKVQFKQNIPDIYLE